MEAVDNLNSSRVIVSFFECMSKWAKLVGLITSKVPNYKQPTSIQCLLIEWWAFPAIFFDPSNKHLIFEVQIVCFVLRYVWFKLPTPSGHAKELQFLELPNGLQNFRLNGKRQK